MTAGLFPIWSGWISQEYSTTHKGVDVGWLLADGEYLPVRAWKDGEVIASGTDTEGGVYVVINHENNQWSGYWHLVKGSNIAKGTKVKEGQEIGIRGNTGLSSGTHLHFLITREGMGVNYGYAKMVSNTINPLAWCYKLKTDNIEKADSHDQYPLPLKPEVPDPVKRNEYKHQVQVIATALRVRTNASLEGEVVGLCKVGYYNVLQTKKADGYTWNRIAKERWIATGEDWTIDLPAKDPLEEEVEKLKAQVRELTAEVVALGDEKAKVEEELTETKTSLTKAEKKISEAKKVLA